MRVTLKRVNAGDVIVRIGGLYPANAFLVVNPSIEDVDEEGRVFGADKAWEDLSEELARRRAE